MPLKSTGKNVPVWDTPDPTKSEKHLSDKKENRARARAAAANRPYPNLIDNMAVSKGLQNILASRYVRPLANNEFYHGTNLKSAVNIKTKGFRTHDPRKRTYEPSSHLRTSEKHSTGFGRPIPLGNVGPGAYMTKDRSRASKYAKGKPGLPTVVRLRVPENTKFAELNHNDKDLLEYVNEGRKGSARHSVNGRVANYYKRKHDTHGIYDGDYYYGQTKHVKMVSGLRPVNIATDTAVIGGAGYYGNKKLNSKPVSKFDTPAWTRSAGKNPEGGLNAKGRASAKAEGHNLKPPVKAGNNPRRASFLARMGNMPGPEHKPNGEPTRLLLSLQKWGASSKEDAKSKAAAMSKSWEVVSKVFPQPAILRQGSRKVRVMVHYDYSPTHWGIVHPRDGQRVAHKDDITFVKRKQVKPTVSPKPVQLDLFGSPIQKSMEYDVSMSQSRFGGASNAGHSFEEIEKAKKRQKPLLTPQQRIFRDLARMEAEHGEAIANGHSTAPRNVSALARGHQTRNGVEAAIANMDSVFENSRQSNLKRQLNRQHLVRGAKIAGVAAVGAGLIGATAYGLHRRNRLSDVTKASLGAGRVLQGASDAVRGASQSGTRSSETSGAILDRISRSKAAREQSERLYGPRRGAALREITPSRVRTKVAMPGGQGGTHARITSHDEIAEMMRQQSMKGKELVLRPKAGLPVDVRPPAPKVKKPSTDLVRVGSSSGSTGSAGASRVTGSSLVPVKSAPPATAPSYGVEANYMPHAAAAAAIGSYGGYKISKRLSEINKAYDEYGNPVKNGVPSGSGSTALGLAGAGTAAYGVKTIRNAGALPRTAPIAEKVAEAANNTAIANSNAARNTVALNQAKLNAAKVKRPVFNGSRAARRTLVESQRQSHMVDRQAQKTAGKLAGTQAALADIPHAMKASRNFGAAAILGGTALTAGVLNNKMRGSN
jgi:hypothetical protein